MPYTLTTLKLKDYAQWKSEFGSAENVAWRRESGQRSYQIYRSASDPNEITLLIEWDSLESAQRHIESAELREKHERHLVSPPETRFLEALETGSM